MQMAHLPIGGGFEKWLMPRRGAMSADYMHIHRVYIQRGMRVFGSSTEIMMVLQQGYVSTNTSINKYKSRFLISSYLPAPISTIFSIAPHDLS